MISLHTLTLRRGPRALLEDVTLTIHSGWHVGLVGRNGTGKSTLFAAMLGQLAADKGSVTVPKQLAVATVAQDTPSLPDLAIEFALDGDVELRALERELAIVEQTDDFDRLSAIHERLGEIGGYAARARAAALLDGLGFSQEAQGQSVASFSGGWRMRLNLARALMCRSDLLLLDEPTNHLDFDAVLWLQGWLQSYRGTMVVISHDREFLDAITDHTIHLERQKAFLYTGNYSQYERQRAEQLTLQSSAYDKQQREVAHLQKFINRFRASAAKATQAQSRVKALERMEMVAAVHADSEFSFEFPELDRVPSPLIRMDGVECGYPTRTILKNVKLLLAPGERIGLLGPNGAGKSTLVRTLAGELGALGGDMLRDPYLRVGYFAQHTTESLDPGASPLVLLRRLNPKATEQELRSFLGGFNFRGDRAYEATAAFSGGEKARLALAMVVYQAPNLLLLDEPTNHLDLDMRHALETALLDFGGAVVLVSHDRHLLTSTSDKLWLVGDGDAKPFDGDLDDYARWLQTRQSQAASAARAAKPSAAEKGKAKKKLSVEEVRAQAKPLKESLRKLDQQIGKLQTESKNLDQRLGDAGLYDAGKAAELTKLTSRIKEVKKLLGGLEEEWMSTTEKLETLEAGQAS